MHSPAQARSSSPFGVSPLMVIGVIFLALVAVESLLAARFWLQLATANASDGLSRFVLDISQPLVAPFSDAQTSAQQGVGSFERHTLVAAMAYLGAAVGLVILTVLAGGLLTGSEALGRRQRRSSLQHLGQPLSDAGGARLVDTVTLSITPEQATRALRMMGLDDTDAQLFVIPVDGGCMIAAFAGSDPEEESTWFSRIGSTRETVTVKRALKQIERRFALQTTRAGSAS